MSVVFRISAPYGSAVPSMCPACAGGAIPSSPLAVREPTAGIQKATVLKNPALISIEIATGDLIYWPIKKGPSDKPITFSNGIGTYQGGAMAANGNTVVVASSSPAETIEYNVKTEKTTALQDMFGAPFDVAVDKTGTIYALSAHEVGVFPSGSSQPYELTCKEFNETESIAVDNEGDVFVDTGYGSFTGVVEIPAGSRSTCTDLQLRRPHGYLGGVGVDPKTDDLIVVDNPGLCAGGFEGRMIIYPKPYSASTSHQHNLHAGDCAGTFRLDATSTHVYVSDWTIDASYPLIDVRSYPSGRGNGMYSSGYTYTGGFTTIPNRLPN